MKKTSKVALGAAGVAATGAALAAAYYLYGSEDAKEHRKKLAAWAKTAEKEILKKAKELKNAAMTDETIKGVIAEVARRYEMTKKIDPKDIREFVGSMQKSFREAKKYAKGALKSTSSKKAAPKKAAAKKSKA